MLRPIFCNYSDAYILVSAAITAQTRQQQQAIEKINN